MGCSGQLNSGADWNGEYNNFVSSITLYDWLFDNFSYRTILDSASFGEKVHVDLAEGDGMFTIRPEGNVTVLLPNDISDDAIETSVTVYKEKLVAPIEANTVLGEVKVSADGKDYGSIKLVNRNDIEMSRVEFIKMQIKKFFAQKWVIAVIIVIIALAMVYFVLVARYRRLRRRHLRERRRAEEQRRIERERMRAKQRKAEREYSRRDDGDDYPRKRRSAGSGEADYIRVDPDERHDKPSDFDELMNKFDKFM